MIIQCQSCSRKFVVKDQDIPTQGRVVQCGYCSVTWHQMPVESKAKNIEVKKVNKPLKKIVTPAPKINEGISFRDVKASDGKIYRLLGVQWAQVLKSGKTGIFAKKKIGLELDKLTGRKSANITNKKKIKKELNPSSEGLHNGVKLPQVYKGKSGLGFFGYLFLITVIGFSLVGFLKTFENDLLNSFPESAYVFNLLDIQLEYLSETVKNMIIIFKDLTNIY